MEDYFAGRRVWITGASSGIGAALAVLLAARGAKLILSARRVEVLQQLRQGLVNPDAHQIICLDLAQPERLYSEVSALVAAGLQVDVLINNAGISQRGRAQDTALSVDRKIMEVNYLGTVALTKAVLPALLASPSAVVATISSVSGLMASQGRAAYSAAKHALMGFMEALRAELHSQGIQVTVACPGWVQTQISINALNEVGVSVGKMEPRIATGISPERCAREFLRAIETGKDEVIIGRGVSVLAPTVKRFLPALFRRLNRQRVYR